MVKTNNWYAITGGPSTGKTTLLAELEKRGFKTVPEAARAVIDRAASKGISVEQLRADEQKFQEEVTQLKDEIGSKIDTSQTVFFDRGMQDTEAYMQYYGFEMSPEIKKMMDTYRYRLVFLLDDLPVYEENYARVEDEKFLVAIRQLLYDVYSSYGMRPICVPAVGVVERADFILSKIKEKK